MTCPVCACSEVLVVFTRKPDCESIVRRRKCAECGYRFYTVEREENVKLDWRRNKNEVV